MRIDRRRAFTLVELLVVIAIIALLIAVLLPVLARAKESANRTICLNNHKEILLGISFYANDNKGYAPHCNWLGQEDTARVPGWCYDSTVPNGPRGYKTEDALKRGALFKYMRNVKIYKCPLDIIPPRAGETVRTITSYGFNGSVNNFGNSYGTIPVPFSKLAKWKPDDIIVWELDEYFHTINSGVNIFNDASNFPFEGITPRHGSSKTAKDTSTLTGQKSENGAIVGCAGMSVQWISVREYFEKEVAPTGRSRLWNNQFTPNGH